MRFYNGYNFPCSEDTLRINNENNVAVVDYCGDLTGRFSLVDMTGDYALINFIASKNLGGILEGRFLVAFNFVQPCKYNFCSPCLR